MKSRTMKRIALWLMIVLTCAAMPRLAAATEYVSDAYFFPIVSRIEGWAGTDWFSEVTLVNPHQQDLVLACRVSAAGGVSEHRIDLQAGAALRWDDFLGDALAMDGNAAMLIEAAADDNPGIAASCRSFVVSMRIFTDADGTGSFGQGIPPLDPVAGFIGTWPAYFTGIRVTGTPGESGHRSNVGFWHLGSEQAELRLRLFDQAGDVVWQQTVVVQPHEPVVRGITPPVEVDGGTLVVDSLGEWVDCAVYVSIVDNRTGDASFRTPLLLDPANANCDGVSTFSEVEGRTVYEQAVERMRHLMRDAGGAD